MLLGLCGRGGLSRGRMTSEPAGVMSANTLVLLLFVLTLMACRVAPTSDDEFQQQQLLMSTLLDDEDGTGTISSNTVQLPGPLQHVVSVVKGKTDLPCDISAPVEDDQASLVLFYKDDASPSIYTYDARDKFATRPRHWSDEQVLGKRAFFTTVQQPAGLAIDNVRESDAGLYRCRVDFRRSPTRNSRVNLTVVVPPKQIRITDEKGVDVDDIIGPFDEDSTLILVCIVMGGNPSPEVTWWQEQRMMDRHAEARSPEQGVRNVLQLERLGRVDLRTSITCQAANTQLTLPLTKSVQIELNLRPLDVRILSSRQPLSSGKKYDLTCQTSGSRPSATVTWWKDGQLLRRAQETLFDGGNVTLSQLSLTLTPEDDGKKLLCRTENPHLGPSSALEDSWLLDVYYLPKVRLELGRNLEGESIREGIDVYFDCHVTARPSAVRLIWRHQGNVLVHNVSAGIIVSESSLVLQRVSRGATGRYTCHATNSEGEGSSNAFFLNVAHKPVCRPEQKMAYGGAKGLAGEVECHVESKPGATSFRWAFNGTGELVEMPMGSYRTTADGSISVLRYTPRSELDFGTLLCWASNPLGTQSRPCVYHIYAAGVPDPPNNCSISNQTSSSFEIDCSEGYDGGIPQHFKMHVFDVKTRSLLANLTSSSPRFALHLGGSSGNSSPSSPSGNGEDTPRTHSWKSSSNTNANSILIPEEAEGGSKTTKRHQQQIFGSIAVIPPVGTLLQVTAVNAHGASESVFIDATGIIGLLPPEMQAGQGAGSSSPGFQFTSTLGILAGIVITAVVMMGTLVACLRFRRNKKPPTNGVTSVTNALMGPPSSKDKEQLNADYIELGTKDPDVITQEKGGESMTPHITNNPLDFHHNGGSSSRAPSTTSCGTRAIETSVPTLSPSQEEVVYAELMTLARGGVGNGQRPPMIQQEGVGDAALVTGGEAVVYAQIDHATKRRNHAKRRVDLPSTIIQPLPDISQQAAVRETALM